MMLRRLFIVSVSLSSHFLLPRKKSILGFIYPKIDVRAEEDPLKSHPNEPEMTAFL